MSTVSSTSKVGHKPEAIRPDANDDGMKTALERLMSEASTTDRLRDELATSDRLSGYSGGEQFGSAPPEQPFQMLRLDAELGGQDAAGDEGAISSKALLNGPVGSAQTAELKSENDKVFIQIDGKQVALKFQGYGGMGADSSSGGTDLGGSTDSNKSNDFNKSNDTKGSGGKSAGATGVVESYTSMPSTFEVDTAIPDTKIDSTETKQAQPEPKPEPEPEISALGQIGGVFKGAAEGLWEAGKGAVNLAANTVNTAIDIVAGPVVGLAEAGVEKVLGRDVESQSWLPNTDRGYAKNQAAGEAIYSMATNPGQVIDAVVDPIAEDWNAGRKGEAIGRGLVEGAGLLVGTKGLDKSGKLGTAANVLDDLPTKVAPVFGKIGEPADAAKVAAVESNAKLDATYGEWKGAVDYTDVYEPKDVTRSQPTTKQTDAMKARNQEANGGILRSDATGAPMVQSEKSTSGVTPAQNEVAVDHIDPVANGGNRSNANLQLITREENGIKSDNLNFEQP